MRSERSEKRLTYAIVTPVTPGGRFPPTRARMAKQYATRGDTGDTSERWDVSASKRHANLVGGMNTPAAQPQGMHGECINMQTRASKRPVAHRGDSLETAYLSHFLGMGPEPHRTSLTSIYYECEGIYAYQCISAKKAGNPGGMKTHEAFE
jgi:hypothetical protein